MVNRETALSLYHAGQKPQEIAEYMHCSVGTIRRIIKAEKEEKGVEYKSDFYNGDGYADPTAYRAMNPQLVPGEVWKVATHVEGNEKVMLILQVFESHAIYLWMTDDLNSIPEGHEEKVMVKGASYCDCGKPQFIFFSRLKSRVGQITLNRLIVVRQKVAEIILRGYADVKPALAPENTPRTDSPVELDKIPTAEEKPQETASTASETGDAETAILRYKASMNEALAGRLLDILEKAVQKGA